MATAPNTNINIPYSQFLDVTTGRPSLEWLMWLMNPSFISVNIGGGLPVTSGGTGLTTIPTNGQLLIGNGTGYTLNTLGYGVGISVTNGSGTITVANTGVLSNIQGNGISVSNSTGDVTISNTGVLSWSGGTTGLTPATATTGAVTLGGTLAIANGGTNGSAAPTAYGIAYGDGTAYAFTAAGTTGQVLTATTGSAPTWASPATSGTVTSVGLAMPAQFTVTNSPVTSSGTLTAAWNTQTANYVLAGPTTGAAATPTFRALVAADIPSLSYVTSVSATAPITSTGGLTPTIAVTSAALSKTDDTNVTVTLGGSPTTALLAATSLTLGWTGQLSVGRGGTGLSSGTSGGIPYFSAASTIASSALLTQYGVVYGGGAASSPVATAAGTTGQVLTATTGGAPIWANPATNGTVTSVNFTGGLISVATATTTPALTVAGTSGGVVYFSSASTWASSAALTANALMVGGGAGVAPSTITTGTGVVTALGVNTGTAGAFVVNGGDLGTPSAGVVTNLTGTASININGTVGATTANTGAFTTLSSTGNTTLGDATTDTVTVNGYMGIGVAPDPSYGLNIAPTALTTSTQIGTLLSLTGTSSATASLIGAVVAPKTAAAAFSAASVIGMRVDNAVKGSGSTITNLTGILILDQTTGTNNYGIRSQVTSGANKWNIYASGTAQNHFSGDVMIFGAGGLGYTTGSGGTVTQGTSRTTGVTLNKTNGAIAMFSAAGSMVATTFTVTNSTVAATDTIILNQKSGTNLYVLLVTAVAAGSFNITFYTTGGVATDAPVINFSIIKAVTA